MKAPLLIALLLLMAMSLLAPPPGEAASATEAFQAEYAAPDVAPGTSAVIVHQGAVTLPDHVPAAALLLLVGMAVLPTVRIQSPRQKGDYAIINERDFDPKVHKRWEPGKEPEKPPEFNATPDAVALAEEHNIDLAKVTGTGKDGRILKSDVEALL